MIIQPAEILQHLIRFNTTNPPGNELECIMFIHDLLDQAGIETILPALADERPNLVARLPGRGAAPPLLIYGHVDVVTTSTQNWQVPPFEGRLQDGYIWGRGALDMKGEVAMFLSALLHAKTEGLSPSGDVIFCAVTDEEAGGDFGAKFLVEQHAELFAGVRYALGEFGGFNLSLAGKRFYPIMIAEKQICSIQATFHGPGGHGSMPVKGGAMAKLGKALQLLDERRLPVHVTPPVKQMIDSLADALGGATGFSLRQLTNPTLADQLLGFLGERASLFAPLLHNTVSPTMLQACDKINVIPSQVSLGLDGRLVPGAKPDQLVSELHTVLGQDIDLEVVAYDPGPATAEMGLFSLLSTTLREADPGGVPIPYVLSGVTDARFFSRLGIQTYGFTPLRLPDDFNFVGTIHAADERVPVEALNFGAQAILRVLHRI